jgi:hypothetical protein
MAHLRAESRARAEETGAAIARKHAQYVTDLLTFVRTLTSPDASMQAALWAAYLRGIISAMCADVGATAAGDILRRVGEAAREGMPDAH